MIFGCGTVGLSALMASRIIGCSQRIVVDNKQSRLDLAPGVGSHPYRSFRRPEVDVVQQIRALSDGLGVQYTFQSSGVKSVVRAALDSLRELGTLVMTGVIAPRRNG